MRKGNAYGHTDIYNAIYEPERGNLPMGGFLSSCNRCLYGYEKSKRGRNSDYGGYGFGNYRKS